MTDLELTVRTIESDIPDMSTKQLQKWKAILTTAVLKIDRELQAVQLHTCTICFFQEYGWRNDLPMGWYEKDSDAICFQHEGNDTIKPSDKPEKVSTEQTLDELMDLI